MRKLSFVFISVVLSVVMFSCAPSPERKVTGVVKEFLPGDGLIGDPKIVFTDNRQFSINHMPDVQIVPGSEIAIYYQTRADDRITPDSIVISKTAPVATLEPYVIKDDIVDSTVLKAGDYESLCKLIVKKGTMVSVSDCQYVYFDKQKNRHAMITIRRKGGKPDISAPIMQISVWVNGKGVPAGKPFYGYTLTPYAINFIDYKGHDVIKLAVKELIDIAKKQ